MDALIDHLWQSLVCAVVLAAMAALTRHHSARLRLWLWRIAALKFLVPFAAFVQVGRWLGFPVRYAGDPPPASLVALVDGLEPWFSASGWLSGLWGPVLLAALGFATAASGRWIFQRIHDEASLARAEVVRLAADPDDHPPSIGFLRAALLTACALAAIALPVAGGALRGAVHAHELLAANTRSLDGARVTLRPAQPGLGSRYFVDVDERGVTIRNVTVRELMALAYGVNRFFVRGKHFRDGDREDWLVDTRHDVRIDAPVLEPRRFDTYALRNAITREVALNFGLEVYVNSECQKPCGKWGERVLTEISPGRWALVDAPTPRGPRAPESAPAAPPASHP